ncbi:MAG: transposase, partial [Pyramidobacter sp.]|nr:transposase [Pyramidobacter sp.]
KYLLSVETTLIRKGTKSEAALSIPVKLVFVRNTEAKGRKAKSYVVLLSTDTTLSEEEIIQLYKRRWSIEVFFKVCKSYLRFAKESRGVSYDSMRAYIAIEFTRYLMLVWLQRMNIDERTMGELFYRYAEELKEPDWLTALAELLRVITESSSENFESFVAVVTKQVETFIAQLPLSVMNKLQARECHLNESAA